MGYVTSRAIPAASGALLTGSTIYRGFTLRETTGAASAVVVLYDSASAAGTILEEISLASGESARENYPDGAGLNVSTGIYVSLASGTMPAGSIRTG